MLKVGVVALVVCLALSLSLIGCGPQKAASSSDAIQSAQAMQTVQEKVTYLVGQANAFYNSKQFQQAIDVAQYVLTALDKDSTQAKDLIVKATEQLKAQAGKAVEDLKGNLGTFGK